MDEIVEFNDGVMRVIDGESHLIVQQDGADLDLGVYEPAKLIRNGPPKYGFSIVWRLITESSLQTSVPEPPPHR